MNRDIAESLTHDHVNNTHQHLDPVCGMEVDPATAAASQEHDGRRYYFCSAGCAEKFQADPSEYVAQTGTSKRPAPSPAAQEHPAGTAAGTKAIYTCPMHPDVRQEGPGACPECGMALEPLVPLTAAKGKTQYICPMHLEIVRDEPASCPICGMALEPRTAAGDGEQEDPEFTDMMRRLWISGVLSVPLLVVAMAPMLGGQWFAARVRVWIELALATPVVLWCGWPLLARGWRSIVTLKLNMFTLVSIGVVTAWAYSVLATIAPGIFPASFRAEGGTVEVYFEAAGVITTLVLLGQVLELRARRRTGAAIKALLSLAELREDQPAAAAAECLQRAIDAGADWPDVHLRLGELMNRSGMASLAKRHYKRALQLNPDYRRATEALRAMAA